MVDKEVVLGIVEIEEAAPVEQHEDEEGDEQDEHRHGDGEDQQQVLVTLVLIWREQDYEPKVHFRSKVKEEKGYYRWIVGARRKH